ncbi:hypothetical protein DICPUDRAFT_100074 [Dictyostelium purpureum]|uniref:Calponin-homology (CH) domain-containing protein n=1 Tax=Dictyostelium purpureum TaxID=5786 RepID=F1A575_DICPU|nr:uncharacterized protein DICPUDRAFT_100074 [Dictyostelium purpureum]EGC28654.1 hypothetical protein DICPUDRAFT_100074 [Dictyostelium purpureum]|eukprot:XP_003294819.1 hypothetical protein DICPUDRAFT_100074 [Dictyostelium purpureum]
MSKQNSSNTNGGNNKQLQHSNSGFLNTSGSPFIKSSSTSTISPFLVSKQSPPSSPLGIHRFNSHTSSSINTPNSCASNRTPPLDNSNFKEKIQQLGWMDSPTLSGNGRMRSNSVAIGSPGSTTFFQYQLEETSKKLEEKEKDAALAAEIGKILLERNQELEEQIGSLLDNEKKYLDCLSEYEFLKNQNEILNDNLKEATNENEILIEKLKQEEEMVSEKSKKLYISQRSSPNKNQPDIDRLNQELEEYRMISQSKDKIISKIKGEKGDLEQRLENLNSENVLYQNYMDEIDKLKKKNRELRAKYKDLKSFSQLNIKKSILEDFNLLKENCQVSFDSIITCCTKIKSFHNYQNNDDELKLLNFTKGYINQLQVKDNIYSDINNDNYHNNENNHNNDNNYNNNPNNIVSGEGLGEPIIIQLISKVKDLNSKYQKKPFNIENSNNVEGGSITDDISNNQDIHLASSCVLKTSSNVSFEEHKDSLIIETSKDSLLRSSLLILISTYLLGIINEINDSLVKEKQTINELLEDISELNEKCQNINKVNLKLEEKLEESNKNLQETVETLNKVQQRVLVLEEEKEQENTLKKNETEENIKKLTSKLKSDLLNNKKQMDVNIQGLSLVIQSSFQEIEKLEKQNSLLADENTQLHIQMEDIVSIKDNDISFIKDQCSKLENKIKIETNNSFALKENSSRLSMELETIKKSANESENHLQSIINQKNSEINVLENKINEMTNQINKLNEDIQTSSSHAIEVLNEQTNLVTCLREELNNNETNNLKKDEMIQNLEQLKNQYQSDVEGLQNDFKDLKQVISKLEKEKEETTKERSLLEEHEKLEKEKMEILEKEKLEHGQLEKERLEKIKLEEQLESEKKEKERLEKEIKEREKLEQDRMEKEKLEKKQSEKEILESNSHDCSQFQIDEKDVSILVYISSILKREVKSECKKCTLELFSDGLLYSEIVNTFIPESIDKRALYKNCSNNSEKIGNIKVSLNSIKVLGGNQNFNAEKIMNNYEELYRFLIEIFYIGNVSRINLQSHPELVYLWKHNPEHGISQSKREESWDSFVALEETCLLRRWVNHFLKIDNKELIYNFSQDFANNGKTILACLMKHIYSVDQQHTQDLDSILKYIADQLLPKQLFVFKDDITKGNQEKIIILLAQLLDRNSAISLSKSEIPIRHDSPDIAPSSEEKACKGWLKTIDISTSSFDDFADGLLLLKALDKVQPGIVNWKLVNMNPTNTFSMTENCNYCVKLGKDKLKFSLVSIAGRDFVDGSKKFLLSFVWQMMRISVLKRAIHIRSNSSGNLNQELTESDIISKINKMVTKAGKSSQIKSFSDPSLKDGKFLLDLLDSIQPGCINYAEIKFKENSESYKSNAQYVITIARRLGCTAIIFWEDIVEVKGNMIMTFICDLINLIKTID